MPLPDIANEPFRTIPGANEVLYSAVTSPPVIAADNPIMKPLLDMLQDSFDYYPDQSVFTWPCEPSMFPQYGPSSYERIDYILFSRHFKIESVEIPDLILSDHKPYIANVELLDDVKG